MFAKEEINLTLSFDFFQPENSLLFNIIFWIQKSAKKDRGLLTSYRMRLCLIHVCSLLLIINKTRKMLESQNHEEIGWISCTDL